MNLNERLQYFEEHYDIISSGHYSVGRKIYITTGSRKCRFCENTKTSKKFSNDSHAIPQFLGNRQLILSDECDECNEFFSNTLEDHLDKYTKPYRVFAAIKGASKVPSYKSKDGKSRVAAGKDVALNLSSPREGGFVLNETNNSFELQFDIEPHVPAAVYKALVKIGISLVKREEEMHAFTKTIQWLKDPEHSPSFIRPLSLMMTFVPGYRPQKKVTACLLRCKKIGNAPYAFLILGFGNWVYQAYIPSHLEASKEQSITYETRWYPIPFEFDWLLGKVGRRIVDLTSHFKAPSTEKITIQFNKKIEVKNC